MCYEDFSTLAPCLGPFVARVAGANFVCWTFGWTMSLRRRKRRERGPSKQRLHAAVRRPASASQLAPDLLLRRQRHAAPETEIVLTCPPQGTGYSSRSWGF